MSKLYESANNSIRDLWSHLSNCITIYYQLLILGIVVDDKNHC